MYRTLDIFTMSSAMAAHAARSQAIIAQNVANADTPGYRARNLQAFDTLHDASDGGALRATRARHLDAADLGQADFAITESRAGASPNGNTVSLETEMMKSTAAQRQHRRALAIYKSALDVLRTAIRT